MNAYTVKTIVRGYHVYRAVWEAAVGQVLPCQQERSNTHDPYAVAVVDRGVIVGHVPRGISSVCYLFINRKGTITCEVTGAKQYTTDLPQGGLEIPCKLMFYGEARLINKVENLLKEALDSGLLKSCDTTVNLQEKSPPKKKARSDPETWLQLESGLTLTHADQEILHNGGWLNDKHINYAQSLLKKQFPHIDGWKNTLLLHREQRKIKNGVQIIHTHGNHWMVASNVRHGESEIEVFDSLYASILKETRSTIINLFESTSTCAPVLKIAEMSKQEGVKDCGVFAIAAATALAFGSDPVNIRQSYMREHLLNCFEKGTMSPFPTL